MARQFASQADIERACRDEHARVLAALVRALGDLGEAEDALQDAYLAALATWPGEGVPRRPAAWLTAVARNRATTRARHRKVVGQHAAFTRAELEEAAIEADIPDHRLELVFACCSPALAVEARVALTLQVVCGVSTPAVARLFLVPEATIAQRLVRAKRKIREARIPFEIPAAERLDDRLDDVMLVVYLLFTEGYSTSDGTQVTRTELCDEAIRLGRVLVHLMPKSPELRGLLALMLLHHARRDARADEQGEIVALDAQDRSRWNAAEIAEGKAHLDEALARQSPGPYQIQAAIAALHATAPTAAATDWRQIAGLYAELFRRQPSPNVALNLAIAEGMASGPEAGLRRLEELGREGLFRDSDRVPAARADLLRRAGRIDEARSEYRRAIALARHAREARFLKDRARELIEGR